jgi:hypothetical protein
MQGHAIDIIVEGYESKNLIVIDRDEEMIRRVMHTLSVEYN